MILENSELLLAVQKNIKSIITIKHEVECIHWTGVNMFLSYFTHPNVTEVTGMESPNGYTSFWQVELVFELNTVTLQADPETLHHHVRGQTQGGGVGLQPPVYRAECLFCVHTGIHVGHVR